MFLTPYHPARQRGFSLVELMVGLAVGLVLLTAMVALVVSVLRANADVVSGAKLNQEGRAIGDIMHRELKRARYSGSYLTFVGAGATPPNAFGAITGADASQPLVNDDCVKFAYDADDDGVIDANEVKSFFLDGGAVYFSQASTYAAALCTNGTGALRLSSPDVVVNALTFEQRADDPLTTGINEQNKNEILVAYELELTRDSGENTGITRDFGQAIQLRNPFLD